MVKYPKIKNKAHFGSIYTKEQGKKEYLFSLLLFNVVLKVLDSAIRQIKEGIKIK